jgi:hypothetical protein
MALLPDCAAGRFNQELSRVYKSADFSQALPSFSLVAPLLLHSAAGRRNQQDHILNGGAMSPSSFLLCPAVLNFS